MQHAVILAHPKPTSFCAAVARACVQHLRAANHQAIVRDLYALDFDPRLQAGELPTQKGVAPATDIVFERKLLAEVKSFIFVYPFWFNAPPAILKGYVDRVFGMGFGYGPVAGGTEPLLCGKTLLSFSTSGAPENWVDNTGALEALMRVFDIHLQGVCGLRVIDHKHFGGVVPNMTKASGGDILEQVRTRLDELFPLVMT